MKSFLVVGGPPRSGTRFITNALNAHDNVAIQGEMHPEVLAASLNYFGRVQKIYVEVEKKKKGEQAGADIWKKEKRKIFQQMVCAGQKISVLPRRKNPDIEGFKLPRAEKNWRKIYQAVGKYSFLYCLRPFEGHFLSCANRWNSNIESVAEQYRESIALASDMVSSNRVSLVAFSLERLEQEPTSHLQHISEKLNLQNAPEWIAGVNPAKKANHAEKFVSDKRTELNEEENAFMAKNTDLADLYQGFWETYDRAQ